MSNRLREMFLSRPHKGFWAMLFCRHDWHIFSTINGWDSWFCRKCGRIYGEPQGKD